MKSRLEQLKEAALSGKYNHEPMSDRDKEITRWCRENRSICNNLTNEERAELTQIALAAIYKNS